MGNGTAIMSTLKNIPTQSPFGDFSDSNFLKLDFWGVYKNFGELPRGPSSFTEHVFLDKKEIRILFTSYWLSENGYQSRKTLFGHVWYYQGEKINQIEHFIEIDHSQMLSALPQLLEKEYFFHVHRSQVPKTKSSSLCFVYLVYVYLHFSKSCHNFCKPAELENRILPLICKLLKVGFVVHNQN